MKTAIIMGNGPSLKDVNLNDLTGYHTFGLNNAYRMYYKLDWWPMYFGCFDYTVTESNLHSFKKLTTDINPIKQFFFIRHVSDSDRITNVTLVNNNKWNCSVEDFRSFNDGGNSGVNAVQVAICLGYQKIVLLGVDCNYENKIVGSTSGHEVTIKDKMQENDHWFEEYYLPGDRINLPNAEVHHTPNWIELSRKANQHDIEIINCSKDSTLSCFKIQDLQQVLV
jgi:hypothetical protein